MGEADTCGEQSLNQITRVPTTMGESSDDAAYAAARAPGKHLHVEIVHARAGLHDLITEYMIVAGKAPDWFWQTAGRIAGQNTGDLDEILSTAFEAGAYISRDQPNDLGFRWIDDDQCDREPKAVDKQPHPSRGRSSRP